MTVQFSVTVWTVLCFLALMLILDRLLFRPLLRFMDERQEKIRRAREAKEQAVRDREAELARRKTEKREREKAAMSRTSAELQAIRQESAEALHRTAAENARRLDALKAELDRESLDIQDRLSGRIDELSAAFAEGLEILVDTGRSSRSEAEVAAPHAELHRSPNNT